MPLFLCGFRTASNKYHVIFNNEIFSTEKNTKKDRGREFPTFMLSLQP